MRDGYSVLRLSSRLAAEGEELVAHRFRGGSVDMVSRCDFERWRKSVSPAARARSSSGFLQAFLDLWRKFLIGLGFADSGKPEPAPVVGIPSEALLRVLNLPQPWQKQYRLGPSEDALFLESSPLPDQPWRVLCFGNGVLIPVPLLHEGQRVKVLRRSWSECLEPAPDLARTNS